MTNPLQAVPVFYRREQNAPATTSPSSSKPQHVVARWQEQFPDQINVRDFAPATFADLCRAHDPDYVRGVLAGTRRNGFGTVDLAVAESLPYTSGSFLAAARDALATGQVAASPTSGFHHAGYAHGGGFCTFNGLMVTALALQAETPRLRVAILDCDEHYGDGTDDIRKQLFKQKRLSALAHWTRGSPGYEHDVSMSRFFRRLETRLRAWADQGADIILYQAGADPHENDPLGSKGFSSRALADRDYIVFGLAKELRIPIVWNLAGGYQTVEGASTEAERIRPVLDIHATTMKACIHTYLGDA